MVKKKRGRQDDWERQLTGELPCRYAKHALCEDARAAPRLSPANKGAQLDDSGMIVVRNTVKGRVNVADLCVVRTTKEQSLHMIGPLQQQEQSCGWAFVSTRLS